MLRQIILDTETTGLSPEQGHRIIEIAGVEIIDRILTGKHFHVYINPERAIDPEAQKVHGISLEFLKDKPVFSAIGQDFLSYINGAEIIAHNASFDLRFLNHELKRLNPAFRQLEDQYKVTDTLALAKKLHIGQRNNLDALCKRYQIDNTKRTLHGALMDAQLLAMVYLAMTGGQSSLFDHIEQAQVQEEKIVVSQHSRTNQPSRVIKANSEELEAHETYLQKIQKKAACVWLTGD
jgi:DNA polymerase-3 subunit epsilon